MNISDSNKIKLLEFIRVHKSANREEIAEYIGVSVRTLSTYLQFLKQVYPNNLIVKLGRHGGGVFWVDLDE